MKKVLFPVSVICLLGALFAVGPRVTVHTAVRAISIPENLDEYLDSAEKEFTDIIPGAEKTILWASEPGVKTEIALVYLHGLSATRQETAPFSDRLADSLDANLFYARLDGHGRTGAALGEATASDWLDDGVEAREIGLRIGNRVLIVGTSTGATLATWLAASQQPRELLGMILLSPNYGPANPAAGVLLWPWGLQIAHLIEGKTHSFEPANELQERFWTTEYPTRALMEMMALVELAHRHLDRVSVPVLAFYSPEDRVIDIPAMKAALDRIGSDVITHEVLGPGGPSGHIIAGDILSPETTGQLVDQALAFVRLILRNTPEDAATR
jgi:esterase/lipase